MPKTKGQGLVFGILMSVTMAYGMEVYNAALKSGVLQPDRSVGACCGWFLRKRTLNKVIGL